MSLRWDADGFGHARGGGPDLAFRACGAGAPVVLLHGTSASHAVWGPVADALADEAFVVSLDQRGHGRSFKPRPAEGGPDSGYDGASFADDIVTVLDALGLPTAVLAGHSLGARNAWVAAARHPSRVRAVVAVDYVPYVESAVLDALQTRVAGGDRVFEGLPEVEAYLQRRYPLMPADAVARRARWGYSRRAEGGWVPLAPGWALDRVVEGFRTSWEEEFLRLAAPLVCLRGERSAVVSDDAWARARRARPDARWVDVAGADHYVPEERPLLVAEEIRRVIRATADTASPG
ncbi:MAG TPA: alpha/beta hydrolase [Microbacteriaceae bacterium]|nr:alpha/beta hydrolase [Microbacteriaceae bacterium]